MALIKGTHQQDTLVGTMGNDVYRAMGEDDLLVNLGGDNVYYGGQGRNTILWDPKGIETGTFVTNETGSMVVDLRLEPGDPDNGSGDKSRYSDITGFRHIGDFSIHVISAEDTYVNTITTDAGDDTLIGARFSNTLTSGAGDDVLEADGQLNKFHPGAGDDFMRGSDFSNGSIFPTNTFYASAGLDTIVGGSGEKDLYLVDARRLGPDGPVQKIHLGLGLGVDFGIPGKRDELSGIERVEYLGRTSLQMAGDDLDNLLSSGAGNDTIYGLRGKDTLDGGIGDDLIVGGRGNDHLHTAILGGEDTLVGGPGYDTMYLYLEGSAGRTLFDQDEVVTVDMVAQTVVFSADRPMKTFDSIESVRINGFFDTVVKGTPSNDRIHGDWGDDYIVGGAGDDTLFGQQGSDTIRGGAGNDIIHGNNDFDLLYGGPGDDEIHALFGRNTIVGGAGNDTMHSTAVSGIEFIYNVNVSPDTGDDEIFGFNNAKSLKFIGLDRDDLTIVKEDFNIFITFDAGSISIYNTGLNPENLNMEFI